MATNNATILNKIWLSGTNDFQQRIPEPTQTNIKEVVDALFDPMNKQYFNQFIDALIMRIGKTYVHSQEWRNPLAVFKKSRMTYGNTLQEIIPKWVRAHAYVDDAEDVFKMARPDVATWYHSVNRRDRYDITVNDIELRTAFESEQGLARLVAGILNAPMNSDEYDEYRIMLQLIAFFENEYGFYKHGLSALPSDDATGKEFLKAVRAYAGKLQFPNTIYNSAQIEDVPVFAKPTELVLLITPDIQATIDVDTLSAVFQLEKAEMKVRTILVDEFPLPTNNAVALLTTEDFFMCMDTVYETTSVYNPKTLGTNYFLHHWGVYSVSPVVPAILFTVGDGTANTIVTQTVTGMTAQIENDAPDKGEDTAITIKLTGSLAPANVDGIKVAPDAATYETTVMRGDDAVNSPATRVDSYGILHVAKSLEYGDVITVKCTSTYVNPSGETTEYTQEVTATVTAAKA